eukprot:4015626-Pyramimonas_sp.AAC.1
MTRAAGVLIGLDTDTEELTVKTLLSRLVTRKSNSAINSLRTSYVRVEPYVLTQEPGDGVRYGFNFSYPIHPPCCDIRTCNIRKDPRLTL